MHVDSAHSEEGSACICSLLRKDVKQAEATLSNLRTTARDQPVAATVPAHQLNQSVGQLNSERDRLEVALLHITEQAQAAKRDLARHNRAGEKDIWEAQLIALQVRQEIVSTPNTHLPAGAVLLRVLFAPSSASSQVVVF